jgi:hypothetical protein
MRFLTFRRHVFALVLASAAGCAADEPPPPPTSPACEPTTWRRVRRLSQREYRTVLADLLGNVPLYFPFQPDPRSAGFDNDADTLLVASGMTEHYAQVAEQAAAALPVDRVAPCAPGADAAACAAEFARGFGGQAYGRPLTDEEAGRLGVLFRDTAAEDGYEDGIRVMAEAILQSPHFLYRTELGEGTTGVFKLTGHEIASQLSFLLTGARPDATLRAAADAGLLTDPAQRRQQAARLLTDPRAQVHLRGFLSSWLGLDGLPRMTKSNEFFTPAQFNVTIREGMKAEVDHFFEEALGPGGGTLDALLLPSESFVTPALATAVYGADALETPASGGSRIKLDPNHRRGILSLPGFLSAHATVAHSSPVDRGLLVLRRLMCIDLPPPPASLMVMPLPAPDAAHTTRQNQEAHSSDPRCAPCHHVIDPVGFGFEQMDGVGKFRTVERGQPVNSQGGLAGTDVDGPFEGPAELSMRLAGSAQLRDCFVGVAWRWAEGRSPRTEDSCALDEHRRAWRDRNRSIGELILDFVASDRFVLRKEAP